MMNFDILIVINLTNEMTWVKKKSKIYFEKSCNAIVILELNEDLDSKHPILDMIIDLMIISV